MNGRKRPTGGAGVTKLTDLMRAGWRGCRGFYACHL
jgi:hypothetical protein